ncbi:MAG TPA: tRNA 2-thiouridine(34) synthase MnmA [Clostridiales bacterium]|nr:tRNA 2-thiouridine(34) synthase MnmA [Clostridiales bacterium]
MIRENDIQLQKRVVVGMSGGVDSAVAALLLKRQGYDVSGVFMKNWDDSQEDAVCPAEQDFEDVRAVCGQIGIPYYSVNFEQEYWDRVFSYFLREYKAGRTPNPDVLCNKAIKFAAFLDFARATGADYIATGHYVRREEKGGRHYLKKGLDAGKDQSYFLCMLSERQIADALFPVGELQKSEVREIARGENLTVAKKKDSTGICFIGERKFKEFLKTYIPANPGDIKTQDGKTVGRHEGLMYYTLGQRRGLAIGGQKAGTGERWFVVKKDLENNVLYVSQGADSALLYSDALIMRDVSFIAGEGKEAFACAAKVRYRQPDQAAVVKKRDDGAWLVEFEKKQRAVTPGQYCVLYDGDTCLGGGVIEASIKEGRA